MKSKMNHDMGSKDQDTTSMDNMHYRHLLIMMGLSFIAMYIFMYAMVNTFSNVYPNFNQFYMAGLMSAPMLILELTVMGSMYKNRKLNGLLLTLGVAGMIVFFLFIKQQVGVSDRQFLKSMIPHHASALLMCEKASINDPEIKELCRNILSGQQSEIDLMKAKLNELKK